MKQPSGSSPQGGRAWLTVRGRSGAAVLGLAACGFAAALLAGCQLPGMLLAQLPERDVRALYKPPDRPTLVLIDDPGEHLPSSPLSDLMAGRIAGDLTRSRTIGSFIPPREVNAARRTHGDFDRWPVAHAGQHFTADQVIHITIDRFDTGASGEMARPTASVRVKIVETESGRRLFPAGDPDGHTITTRMFYRDGSQETRFSTAELERELAGMLAADVAKLFYKHPPRRIGSGWHD